MATFFAKNLDPFYDVYSMVFRHVADEEDLRYQWHQYRARYREQGKRIGVDDRTKSLLIIDGGQHETADEAVTSAKYFIEHQPLTQDGFFAIRLTSKKPFVSMFFDDQESIVLRKHARMASDEVWSLIESNCVQTMKHRMSVLGIQFVRCRGCLSDILLDYIQQNECPLCDHKIIGGDLGDALTTIQQRGEQAIKTIQGWNQEKQQSAMTSVFYVIGGRLERVIRPPKPVMKR